MKTQILSGVVSVLHLVGEYRPIAFVGVEQGGLMVLMCSRPLLLEAVCQARIVTCQGLVAIRKA